MADPDALILAIEEAAYEAWPPEHVATVDGWRLFSSGGFSRRVNSAAPTPWSQADLDRVGEWFSERGLPFVVRITPQVVAIDQVLDDEGFTKEAVTDVMSVDLVDAGSPGSEYAVEVAGRPGNDWLDAQAELQGVPTDLVGSWHGIISRIERPAAFALVRDERGVAGAGFAVGVGSLVGLFEINVAPTHRRRGIGTAISKALLAWGYEAGGRTGYLQVLRANEGAVALYRSLGFEARYSYWYRRAPPR